MSMSRTTALVMAAGLLLVSTASAAVIYQDDFSEATGTIMNGKSLDVANGIAGGTAGATWTATAAPVVGGNPDALWTTSGSNTADIVGAAGAGADANLIENNLLPFTPQAGNVYDLHLEMSPSGVGASGNWLGLSFTNGNFNGHTPGGGASALSNNNPFGLIILKGTGQVQSFAGNGTANGVINTAVGFIPTDAYTAVDIVLDTRPALWSIKWLLNGTQQGATFNYTTNPTIGLLAFGTNKLSGSVRNFSLTNPIPEPGCLLLAAFGVIAAARFRKRAAR
jgi:hypothetical protein